jgi:DNA-binding XRE family transcriptional regulator
MGHARPLIRQRLGLSQREMLKRLGVENQIDYTTISKYELDKNEPPLGISSGVTQKRPYMFTSKPANEK